MNPGLRDDPEFVDKVTHVVSDFFPFRHFTEFRFLTVAESCVGLLAALAVGVADCPFFLSLSVIGCL